MGLQITRDICIRDSEIRVEAVRAGGPGGQNVNKVSSAVHLRFDSQGSHLPRAVKDRLMAMKDRRISKDGTIVIKARRFRTREKNLGDARERLKQMILAVLSSPRKRRPTTPSRAARKKRLDEKNRHGRLKKLRGRVRDP